MTTIHIPSTLNEAVENLGAIGQIVTAREWERAAILATYVQPGAGQGARTSASSSGGLVSATVFASHGIHGLRSKDTVLRYVENWLAERPRPTPGEDVILDGLPDWPPDHTAPARNITGPERREALVAQAEADGTGASKVLDIASNPKAMAAAIKADPDVANAAMNALVERNQRDPRLAPPPQTPEGKALDAMMSGRNAASRSIHQKIHEAAVLLEESQRNWDINFADLAPREKAEVHAALVEIETIASTLRMNLALEEAD